MNNDWLLEGGWGMYLVRKASFDNCRADSDTIHSKAAISCVAESKVSAASFNGEEFLVILSGVLKVSRKSSHSPHPVLSWSQQALTAII